MDKQEAIAFILREYAQGAKPADIAIRLSVLLGAPADLTDKFVTQTIAQHTHAATQPMSEALVQHNAQLVQSAQAAPAPLSPRPSPKKEIPLPPQPAPESTWQPAQPSPANTSWSPPPASTPSWQAPAPAMSQQPDPELEAFVLRALTKSSKQSDVVMMVCERENLNWDEAQRIVARIATQNRKKLTGRQNRIIIPLAVIAIIVGLLLAYAGLREIYLVTTAIEAYQAGNPAAIPVEARDPMRNAPWAVLAGLSITLGGIFGLFKAIKAQVDA